MQKYVFKKYDPVYNNFFKLEKNNLQKLLGKNILIEHVGSTSVPGLGGKGIIDIVISSPKDQFDQIKKTLTNNGYLFRPNAGTSTRLFFRTDYYNDKNVKLIHIHLVEKDSRDWKEMIVFREKLTNNLQLCREYVKIKKKAVKISNGNGDKYKQYKEKFINKVLKNAIQEIRKQDS